VNAYAPDPALKTEWTWDRQELDIARWLATLPRPVGLMACSDERAWHVTGLTPNAYRQKYRMR